MAQPKILSLVPLIRSVKLHTCYGLLIAQKLPEQSDTITGRVTSKKFYRSLPLGEILYWEQLQGMAEDSDPLNYLAPFRHLTMDKTSYALDTRIAILDCV